MTAAIHHLNLMTGYTRSSHRGDIGDRTIGLIRPAVLAGGGRLGDTGWLIRMISGKVEGGAAFEFHYERAGRSLWIATCHMAWTDAGSDEMWRAAQTHRFISPNLDRPASLPWSAGAQMMDAFSHSNLVLEAIDLECSVAWTVLDVCRPADLREAELTPP